MLINRQDKTLGDIFMTKDRKKTTGGALMAVDALGRPLPSGEAVPSRRTDRRVGLFYFLWLGEHGRHRP
jgi:hypothetical protein